MPEKTTSERLAVIETEIVNIKDSLNSIKNNHLDSIYKKFDDIWKKFTCFEKKINNRLPGWATLLIAFLCSLSTGLIIYGVMR